MNNNIYDLVEVDYKTDLDGLSVLVMDESGTPILEMLGELKFPANYSFSCVNNFVHTEADFEDLQYLALGMATHIATLNSRILDITQNKKQETPTCP